MNVAGSSTMVAITPNPSDLHKSIRVSAEQGWGTSGPETALQPSLGDPQDYPQATQVTPFSSP